jgi:hypothetical protein
VVEIIEGRYIVAFSTQSVKWIHYFPKKSKRKTLECMQMWHGAIQAVAWNECGAALALFAVFRLGAEFLDLTGFHLWKGMLGHSHTPFHIQKPQRQRVKNQSLATHK